MWQRWNQTTHIFEKSTDNGNIWTPLGLNAAIITEGVMDPARLPPAIPPTKPNLPATIAYEDEANTFTQVQEFQGTINVSGGGGTDYSLAPIEVIAANARIGFHWPGVIASSVGVSSDGTIRTFNNPGTDYAPFAASSITAVGNLRATGSVGCDTNQWRSNIHPEGYVYPGRMTEGGGIQASWMLAGHSSYGIYCNTGFCTAGGLWTTTHVACGTSMSVGTTLNIGGAVTFAYNTWNFSADGQQRIYFGANANTYIKAPTDIVLRAGNTDGDATYIAGHGGITSAWGWRCRPGVYGATGANWFNFHYTGAIQTWIDALHVGDLFLAAPSDKRVKRDFTPLGNTLDKILKMRPGTFHFLPFSDDFDADPRMHLGMLAQDVQEVAPEVVYNMDMKTPMTPDGALRVDYMEIIPMLVGAIQELNRKVEK